jgi:hypothetical protein
VSVLFEYAKPYQTYIPPPKSEYEFSKKKPESVKPPLLSLPYQAELGARLRLSYVAILCEFALCKLMKIKKTIQTFKNRNFFICVLSF